MTAAGDGLCSFVEERGSGRVLHQDVRSQGAVGTGGVKAVRKIQREAEGSNVIPCFRTAKLQASILQAGTLT